MAADAPTLETRDLRLVRTVVDCGGLARAAERLHCTPSALSHRLADLERRLGVRLFARIGRGLVPTPAAETLHEGAAGVLARLGELEAAARGTVGRRVAAVRLATECFTCYHWLPRALQLFEAAQPRVEVRIVLAATRRAVRALAEGELDVAISDAPPRDARFAAQPLFASDLLAVVAPAHRWAGRRQVRAADFAGEHLLRYPMPRQQSTLLHEVLDPAGVELAGEEGVELTEAILELVRAGRGVAVLPAWVVTPWVARGEVVAVPLREPAARRRWYAVTRRQQRPDEHVAALVAALRQIELPGTRPLGRRRATAPATAG